MIRVRAPSRLHFGLLSVGDPADPTSLWTRRYGSVGLMVQGPGVQLTSSPAAAWSAEGPLAERALAFARRFAESLVPDSVQPQRLVVERTAPEHAGLGTGTQLGMAVARALALAHGKGHLGAADLSRRVGRGLRSALGVHGFAQGGFLVEGGTQHEGALAPLVARANLPETWRIVLVLLQGPVGLHGSAELRAFEQLAAEHLARVPTGDLCRLVLLGMLPALAEQDLQGFGEALYEFNRRVGEAFAPVQGGTYASTCGTEIVAFLRGLGVRGVGQSSWGPTVFAVVGGEGQGKVLAGLVRRHFALPGGQVLVTAPAHKGAQSQQG
jgi:beta-RFAP synthase